MHPAIARRIVGAAQLAEGETVLEVGPGKGLLTRALLDEGVQVVAVEADSGLIPGLNERFASELAAGRLVLVEADIRAYLAGPAKELPEHYSVVANIPYYLTGELLRTLLERAHQPRSMTLLVQKEVAERMVARGGKESLLSLSVKAYGEPRYAFGVPRGAFAPAPRVDSAVVRVAGISRAHFASAAEEARFFALIHAGFAHKRKQVAANLAGLATPAALAAAVVAERARAEDVPLAAWLALSKAGARA